MLVELVIFIVLIVTLRKYLFKSRAEKLYDKIPGPKPYPIVGNMFEFNYPEEEPTVTLKNLSKKYGPVYLMRVPITAVVFTSNPSDAEYDGFYDVEVYGEEHPTTTDPGEAAQSKAHRTKTPTNVFHMELVTERLTPAKAQKFYKKVVLSNNARKPDSYSVFAPVVNQGLFTSSGEEWRKQRKFLTPAFHVPVLQSFIPSFDRCANLLVKNLSEVVGNDFDVSKLIGLCSFDIICETAMGLETQVQDKKDLAFLNAVDELAEIITHRFYSMVQNSFLFHFMSIGRRHNRLINYIHGVTEEIIHKRREDFNTSKELDNGEIDIGIKQKKPFLDLMLEYSSVGTGMGLTDLEIRQQVITFMIAGYDTSQTAMSFTLYCLSQHSEIQERVYQEIRKIFGESDREATYQDLQEMRYLENVIKESMRIYPVSRIIPRLCCEEITLKSGYVIPKNTEIIILMEAMYHDPQVYPDPFTFDPDRYEKKSSLYSYLHFGGGIRDCIGRKFALLEMKTVLSRVLRNYRILPSDIPLDLKFNLVLKSASGVNIRIEPRNRV